MHSMRFCDLKWKDHAYYSKNLYSLIFVFYRLFLVRESSVQGGFVISYYFNGRAYHAPVMPFTHPSTSAVTYSLDEGKTKFYDLLQLVEFYQLNKGTLCGKLTHFVINKISVTRSESPTDSTSSCKHASDVSLDRWVFGLSQYTVYCRFWPPKQQFPRGFSLIQC